MTEEEATRIVDRLMKSVPLHQVMEKRAIEDVGVLVDLAGDLGREDGVDVAIAAGERLLALSTGRSRARCLVHYFMANAWEVKRHCSLAREGSPRPTWSQPELEHQIVHLRLAARLSEDVRIGKARQRQIYTNLGNLFSHCGRLIEAIWSWDRALQISPDFGMALGNRGYGLEQYATRLHDPGHQLIVLREAWRSLEMALKARGRASVYPEARAMFEGTRARIENYVPLERLRRPLPHWESERRMSRSERTYRSWCLQERLFLNDLNDLGAIPIAAADVLVLPSIVTGIASGAPPFGLFNQLKQEYVSARYLYFEGVREGPVHFSDRDVAIVDTLDYCTYSLNIEKVKICLRVTFALFDKMAYFLNDYFRLGIPEREVAFRTLWYERQNPKKGMRGELQTGYNPALHGLFWLAKDLHERDPRFAEALEPEAKRIADLRNHLEHKYVKVHEMGAPDVPQVRESRDPLRDSLAYGVGRRALEEHALWVLRTVRAGLIYLSAAVLAEEARRAKAKPGLLAGPVILRTLPDRFKR
jgi:HEPN superfamily protein